MPADWASVGRMPSCPQMKGLLAGLALSHLQVHHPPRAHLQTFGCVPHGRADSHRGNEEINVYVLGETWRDFVSTVLRRRVKVATETGHCVLRTRRKNILRAVPSPRYFRPGVSTTPKWPIMCFQGWCILTPMSYVHYMHSLMTVTQDYTERTHPILLLPS